MGHVEVKVPVDIQVQMLNRQLDMWDKNQAGRQGAFLGLFPKNRSDKITALRFSVPFILSKGQCL